MHIFGHPCELDGLLAIAKDFNLVLVGMRLKHWGAFITGKHVGTFGLFGTLSFNGNKILTTGGGGMILTDQLELAKRAKHLTTTAKLPHSWDYVHDEVGYNYRMPNLNAAFGCAQLEQLPNFIASKRRLFEKYYESFRNVSKVFCLWEPDSSKVITGCKTLYWINQQRIKERNIRNNKFSRINDRPAWTLLHNHPYTRLS